MEGFHWVPASSGSSYKTLSLFFAKEIDQFSGYVVFKILFMLHVVVCSVCLQTKCCLSSTFLTDSENVMNLLKKLENSLTNVAEFFSLLAWYLIGMTFSNSVINRHFLLFRVWVENLLRHVKYQTCLKIFT